jgi:hypothetical protein
VWATGKADVHQRLQTGNKNCRVPAIFGRCKYLLNMFADG